MGRTHSDILSGKIIFRFFLQVFERKFQTRVQDNVGKAFEERIKEFRRSKGGTRI